MQSYLQYRRLGNAVRKQLADFPLQQQQTRANDKETGNVIANADENANANANEKHTDSTPSDSETSTAAENASVNSDQIEEDIDIPSNDALGKSHTRNSEKTAIAYHLPGIEVRSHVDDSSDRPSRVFVVGWDGINDPQHPRNYSVGRRLTATLIVSALGFIVGAASSINSGVLPQNNAAFGISDVVGSLVDGKT